ncbi:MAG: phosphatidyl-myo-inositol dimannoside synthase [Chloroflexota bacterium]|jgi:phosphatidylinositol alpha-1,6-mannosyltransferase|nr:phosphatidyl-myo-inositol dimannoside synthase [Chloroflexota bacterium]
MGCTVRDLRVLVITPDYPPARGGIQTLVHRVTSGFDRAHAHVLTLDHPDSREFDSHPRPTVERVGGLSPVRRARTLWLNAAALRVARAVRPDIVLSAHIITSPAAAAIRRLMRVPVVQYVYAKELGAKPHLARFALANADRVIAISHYAAELTYALGGRPERTALITPGVDLPAEPVVRSPLEQPTMLTVARMEDRYKGHDVLARALPLVRSKIPGVQWVVIGDGPLRPGLEQLVQSHGVGSQTRFLGSVDDVDRDYWLRSAHVFTMPSRLPAGGFAGEGFGIVYLEANAHGMPVVAGNVAGAIDAVVDGETGLLVDPADHLAVGRALVDLLSDRGRAEELGRAGAERARGFAWPLIAERVERLLEDTARR